MAKITPEPPEEHRVRSMGRTGSSDLEWVSGTSAGQGGWYRGKARRLLVPLPDREPDGGPMYREVPPQVDLPAVEHDVLTFWDEHDTFHKSLRQRDGRAHVDVLRGASNGQRHARHPPHRGARVQGRVPPVPHDEGVPSPSKSRMGLSRASRSSWPSRKSSASPASKTSRSTALLSSTPSAASQS